MMHETESIYKRALLLAIPMTIQSRITNMVNWINNVMVNSLRNERAQIECIRLEDLISSKPLGTKT